MLNTYTQTTTSGMTRNKTRSYDGKEKMHANVEVDIEEAQYMLQLVVPWAIRRVWLLLDNQSIVDQFINLKYLTNMHTIVRLVQNSIMDEVLQQISNIDLGHWI